MHCASGVQEELQPQSLAVGRLDVAGLREGLRAPHSGNGSLPLKASMRNMRKGPSKDCTTLNVTTASDSGQRQRQRRTGMNAGVATWPPRTAAVAVGKHARLSTAVANRSGSQLCHNQPQWRRHSGSSGRLSRRGHGKAEGQWRTAAAADDGSCR